MLTWIITCLAIAAISAILLELVREIDTSRFAQKPRPSQAGRFRFRIPLARQFKAGWGRWSEPQFSSSRFARKSRLASRLLPM
jgi:hypothetical protein